MSKIIVETDSQIPSDPFSDKFSVPSQIKNLIENINVLINAFEDIQFLHCNRIVNRLVDKLAKKRLIFVILQKSVLINFIEFPFNYIYIYIRRE